MKNWFDNDLYKFTMMQAVWEKFPNTRVKYKFYWRNHDNENFSMIDSESFKSIVEEFFYYELNSYTMRDDIIKYLRQLGWFKDTFLDFLNDFYPKPYVFSIDEKNYTFTYEGTWINTILLEVPILSFISENIMKVQNITVNNILNKLDKQLSLLGTNNIKFVDFGTRRRFNGNIHEMILNKYKDFLIGTSNVYYAYKLDLKPIGTMAHEWIMAHQVLAPLYKFEKVALENWADVYRGDLGIALSDTISLDYFLTNTFDTYLSKLFDGVRIDSNCSEESIKKVVGHYLSLGIDPKTKHIVLSDSLKFDQLDYFKDFEAKYNTNIAFGIGTSFTNPTNAKLDIVIKLVEVNGLPVMKKSDNPHKIICEDTGFKQFMLKFFN